MSVQITSFIPQIKNATAQKASIFLRTMADEMTRESEPNTPKKSGRLRMDVVKQVLGLKGKVVWGKNYSVFQEKKQYQNYTTAGTGPHFAENSAKTLPGKTVKVAKSVGLI